MAEVITEFMVRRAQTADADALTAIWLEAVTALCKADPRFGLADDSAARWGSALHGWLTKDSMAVLVAERADGKVLGYIVGAVVENTPGLLPERFGLVSDVAVDFHAKSGRIGREMLNALQDWFRAQGVKHVQAQVPARHAIAQAFWRAIGAGKLYESMWLRLDGRDNRDGKE